MSTRRFRKLLLLAAAVGALHALVYTPFVAHETNDSRVYIAAAEALLDGRYSTPLRAASLYDDGARVADLTGYELPRETWSALEAQAFRTPGYPLLLAAVGGGARGASQALLLVVQSLLLGAAVIVLGYAVLPAFGERAALVGAWLFALDPISRHYSSLVLSEALATLLAAAALYAFSRAWLRGGWASFALAGLAVGALTLTRTVFVLLAALLPLVALARRGGLRSRGLRALALAGAAAVVLTPWLAWTYATTGAPVLTTLSRGTGLLYAAHGEGHGRAYGEIVNDPAFAADLHAPHRYAPGVSELLTDPHAHPRYVRLADEEYARLATQRYERRLRDEPVDVAADYLYRAYALWQGRFDWPQLASRLGPLAIVLDTAVLALALAGMALVARRSALARSLALLLFAYTAASAAFHVEARYGIPLRGLLLAFAAFALTAAGARVAAR